MLLKLGSKMNTIFVHKYVLFEVLRPSGLSSFSSGTLDSLDEFNLHLFPFTVLDWKECCTRFKRSLDRDMDDPSHESDPSQFYVLYPISICIPTYVVCRKWKMKILKIAPISSGKWNREVSIRVSRNRCISIKW